MALAQVPAAAPPAPGSEKRATSPQLSIVIVNWSTRDDLIGCLRSLETAVEGLSTETIVVDNGSPDGSAEAVERLFPELTLIQNRRNAGFARANNQALRLSRGRYILLLNPDTIAGGDALRGLLDFMERTPGAGAAGLQLRFPDGRLQNSYDSFPTFGSELISKHLMRVLFPSRYPSKRIIPAGPLPVDIVIGACLILRREVVETLGGFDERYFLFVEEADLCWRIRRAGWEVYHLPQLSIVHDAKAAKAQATAHASIEFARSSYRFYSKSMTPLAAWTLRALKAVKVVLVNPLLSSIACGFTLGRVSRHRRRLLIRAHLCAWHLLGCPDSWGMRQVSPLCRYRRLRAGGRESIVAEQPPAGLLEAVERLEGGDGSRAAGSRAAGSRAAPGPGGSAAPPIPLPGDLRILFSRPGGLLRRLHSLSSVPEPILTLERAEDARDRGVAAIAPLAAGAVRRFGFLRFSFLVLPSEPALVALPGLLEPGKEKAEAWLRAAARFLRRLHDAGIDPHSVSAVSALAGAEPGESSLILSEPARASFGPPLLRGERLRALSRLARRAPALGPRLRRRFLLAYFDRFYREGPAGEGKAPASGRRPLRVLHLFSNHKLTGPAETALDAARAVGSRPGVAAEFVAGAAPDRSGGLRRVAVERGARVADLALELPKHFSPRKVLRDGRRLRARLRDDPPDLIHCHLGGDHLVALLSAGKRIPIVRSFYGDGPPRRDWRARRTLGSARRIICFSRAVRSALAEPPHSIPPERLVLLEPPIDLARFDPRRPLTDARALLGIPPGAFAAGIAARLQTHRRFEALFAAADLVRRELPDFRLVVIGRGTHAETVGREPVRRLGLEETVRFTGYLGGEEYVGALRALDLSIFLVPGSDGTCRAVREALAMGLPVVAARRGILPELVKDQETGLLIEDTPENLAAALIELGRDRARLGEMSAAARRDAEARFSYGAHATALESVYRSVVAER